MASAGHGSGMETQSTQRNTCCNHSSKAVGPGRAQAALAHPEQHNHQWVPPWGKGQSVSPAPWKPTHNSCREVQAQVPTSPCNVNDSATAQISKQTIPSYSFSSYFCTPYKTGLLLATTTIFWGHFILVLSIPPSSEFGENPWPPPSIPAFHLLNTSLAFSFHLHTARLILHLTF